MDERLAAREVFADVLAEELPIPTMLDVDFANDTANSLLLALEERGYVLRAATADKPLTGLDMPKCVLDHDHGQDEGDCVYEGDERLAADKPLTGRDEQEAPPFPLDKALHYAAQDHHLSGKHPIQPWTACDYDSCQRSQRALRAATPTAPALDVEALEIDFTMRLTGPDGPSQGRSMELPRVRTTDAIRVFRETLAAALSPTTETPK